MKSIFLFCIVFVLGLTSCEKPCGEASTGPPSFRVKIIDSTTNENVFTNGTYTENQVSVSTTPITNSFLYGFISEDNSNIIQIFPSWSEGTFTTTIELNNQISIPIVSVVYKNESRCYTNYFIQSVAAQGFEGELDTSTGIYKIKI